MSVSRPTRDPVPIEPAAALGAGMRAERSRWPWIVGAIALALLVWWMSRGSSREAGEAGRGTARRIPVVAVPARSGDLPITLAGLGTVTAFNTVTVRSRVDGQLVKVAFQEGQFVAAGDLLAEIDPRPFQAQLTQAEGQLSRNVALLRDAQLNLKRFKQLLERRFVSTQQYDDQAATVAQLQGAVKVDEGAIAAARLNLDYTRITAPIGGRVGLRVVDAGNMVHASDQNGLVVITQMEPSAVVFTIPEDHVPALMKRLAAGGRLPVEAYDRANRTKIADGELGATDNQIDPTTGTFRLKAIFPNEDHALFPNQFVNVRLLLDVRKDATLIPQAAIQRGPTGTFVYLVKEDSTVEVRPVTVDATEGLHASISSGLRPGEPVVVDGTDKLRAGAAVELREATASAAATPGA